MKIALDRSEGIYTLHSYRNETIIVRPPHAAPDEEDKLLYLQGGCLLSTTRLIAPWQAQTLDELHPEHLHDLIALNPEVILLGSGQRMRFPTATQVAALVRLGIGYEVMDTAAACRTFNVLAGERRRVVAVLFSA